jgi:Putative peptidoglycan binding domain
MQPYVVRDGDYLTKLAVARGATVDAVWNDPANARLKALRNNPDLLQPGDVLYLPAEKRKWISVANGENAIIQANVPTVAIRLVLHQEGDDGKNLLAGMKYRIEGLPIAAEGTLNDEGLISIDVPVLIPLVFIVIDEAGLRYPVRVGAMDPVEESSGLRKRLIHLGYFHDGLGGDQNVTSALKAFQAAQGIEVTGTPDEATRKALLDAHGG